MTDEPEPIVPDEWIRFDMWAERAHEACIGAIEAERDRPGEESTSALADVYSRAADIYRDLANSSAPAPKPEVVEPVIVHTEAT